MNEQLETFLLYYECWHEKEIDFTEFRENLISDLGEDGMKSAVSLFRDMCSPRWATGDRRTYYELMKS